MLEATECLSNVLFMSVSSLVDPEEGLPLRSGALVVTVGLKCSKILSVSSNLQSPRKFHWELLLCDM